jgi:hypothetical protein
MNLMDYLRLFLGSYSKLVLPVKLLQVAFLILKFVCLLSAMSEHLITTLVVILNIIYLNYIFKNSIYMSISCHYKYIVLFISISLFIFTNCSYYINMINKTHFDCDQGKNILHINKFNDDFCDCQDGRDENSNYNNLKYIIIRNKCLY